MDYYHFVRREILPLLPKKAPASILEVGAGAGATLKWLKTRYPSTKMTAVELNPDLLEELKLNADVAIIGSIEDRFAPT